VYSEEAVFKDTTCETPFKNLKIDYLYTLNILSENISMESAAI
jgi:hypothetical protein